MNAKEYLKSIKRTDTDIKRMEKQQEQLQGKRYKITQNLNPVMVSGGGMQGGFSNASDDLIDLETVIDREKQRFERLRNEACVLIRRVEDEKLYNVLYRYYILYESFERIAADEDCRYRTMCYRHGRALQAFQKVLDKQHAT